MYYIPNYLDIKPEIFVNSEIPKSNHFSPRNLWIKRTYFVGNIFRCFTDDFEITKDCIDNYFILLELLRLKFDRIAFNFRNRGVDIIEKYFL